MAPADVIQHLRERWKLFTEDLSLTKRRFHANRWELGIIITLGTVLSLIYYFSILKSGNNLGIQDWDQNFAWTEATRISIIDYHQFPLWNSYKCGGTVQFANPQVAVISIQTVFALIFGTLRGIKLSIFFHGVIGFVGFYYLARQYKLSYVGNMLAAIIFSFSGITGSFLSSGMVVFTNFAYTPYILISFNKSIKRQSWGIICGILFALSFYYSYQIPLLLGVYIIIYTIVYSITNKSIAPLKAFIIMVVSSAFLILPKLLFSEQLLRISPRQLADVSGFSIQNFLYFLLSRKQNLFNEMNVKGYFYEIDENSIYIGVLAFVIFLLFFVKNRKVVSGNLPLVITLIVILWLMLGNVVHPSLYEGLRQLPIFSSFRVAQRFRFDFIIPLSLIAGLGIDNVMQLLQSNKLGRLVAVICLGIIYIDMTMFSNSNFLSKTLIIVNPESRLTRSKTFTQTIEDELGFEIHRTIELPDKLLNSNIFIPWSFEYLKIKQNKGVLDCYDPIPLGVSAIGNSDAQYQGEFHLLTVDDNLKVENTFWSLNKLIFDISTTNKAVTNSLIVNQNFYPGWVVRQDNEHCQRASFNNGLLATNIDGAIRQITFTFDPISYYTLCR